MIEHKATPEQWARLEWWASQLVSATDSCILDLRSKVETLEAVAHKHIVETSANILALASRVEALEAAKRPTSKVYEINEPLQLTPEQARQITDLLTPNLPTTSSRHPAKPDSALVKRVALAINEAGNEVTDPDMFKAAAAAILEVAAWMRSNPSHHFSPALVFALEQEAER